MYWLLAVAGRCTVVWLWLICFKLLCWPAVNVSVTFNYALLLFLCFICSVILICIWLFNTPFILPGEVLVCFSVSCQYAYTLPARFTDTGPSGPNTWWQFEVRAHGPPSSTYPGLGCDPVGSKVTGENRSTGRKPSRSVYSSTANSTQTKPDLNPDICDVRPATAL
jgi:hypothetical protein